MKVQLTILRVKELEGKTKKERGKRNEKLSLLQTF